MKARNKALIIFGIILLVVAVVMFFMTGYMAGWDIAGWFKSNMAMWCYIILSFAVLIFGYIIIKDKINRI